MSNYSLQENRISAFIFIEDKFYVHKYHTECVTDFLKEKEMINEEEELYKLLKHNSHSKIARQWIEEIEENCVFGEVAKIDNELCVIIFDIVTMYGIKKIKIESEKFFGIKKVYIAQYIENTKTILRGKRKFNLIEV